MVEKKIRALVTNDDGFSSILLQKLVSALSSHFEVSVAAPLHEQSWTGRAMTRHGEISVERVDSHFENASQAWAISGTPSDCVNIALGNLLTEKPDIVVSGINIGFNTSETLILSSGTIAGAIEGMMWDLPAIAFSQCIPEANFEAIRDSHGNGDPSFNNCLQNAAKIAADLAVETHQLGSELAGSVVNVNFPAATQPDTAVVDTVLAKLQLGSLFERNDAGNFEFRYSNGTMHQTSQLSDREALHAGKISRTVLDFSNIGRPID